MISSEDHSITDLEWIEAYQKTGDLSILGSLYKNYMPLIYGVCLKYLKNREDSKDAVSQIFEKLIETVKNSEIGNFKSWLYVLTKNHCLMQLRSAKYKSESQMGSIDTDFMENQLLVHREEEGPLEDDLSQLEKCIEDLQLDQKQCVEMFFLQKKSYKEIEQLTPHDLKKIKSYIQNGKRNLKICMEQHSEPGK